jgi:hypothetical protein
MKKKIVLSLGAVAMLATAGIANAAGITKKVEIIVGGTAVTLNNKAVTVPGGTIIYNGQVYAPIKSSVELAGGQVSATNSKVDIKTGTFIKGKYQGGKEYDAAELKVSPLITASKEDFKAGEETVSAFNKAKFGTQKILVPLGKNFSVLKISGISVKSVGSMKIFGSNAKGEQIGQSLSDLWFFDTNRHDDLAVDVSSYDYVLIDNSNNFQLYNITLTAK